MTASIVTVAVSLLLLQLAAAAENVCQQFPGLPGRDGRDGRDGAPGVPGPAGLPGNSEMSNATYQELREKLINDIPRDPMPSPLNRSGSNITGNTPITDVYTDLIPYSISYGAGAHYITALHNYYSKHHWPWLFYRISSTATHMYVWSRPVTP